MSDGSEFNEDYFLRGKELGISGYENYRWLPDLTIPMAARIVCHLDIKKTHTVLDFGCARGYTVKAMRRLGYEAWGYDVSQWALANADESVKQYLIANESALFKKSFDWVIAKDVLEHVENVKCAIIALMEMAKVGVFVVVPLDELGPQEVHLVAGADGHNEAVRSLRRVLNKQVRRLQRAKLVAAE